MNSNFPSEIITNGSEMQTKDRDLMWLRYHPKFKVQYHLGLARGKEKGKCHPQNEQPTSPEASLVMGAHWRAGGTYLYKLLFIAAQHLIWKKAQSTIDLSRCLKTAFYLIFNQSKCNMNMNETSQKQMLLLDVTNHKMSSIRLIGYVSLCWTVSKIPVLLLSF